MLDVKQMTQPLYRTLADLCCSIHQCNDSWAKAHADDIEYLEEYYLPRGSGFDAGCSVRAEESGPKKLVIDVPYHYMDEYGGYRGWWDVVVEVIPQLDVTEMDMDATLSDPEESPMDEWDLGAIGDVVWDALMNDAPRCVQYWRDIADFCGPDASRDLVAVVCAANRAAEQVQQSMAQCLSISSGTSDECFDMDPVARQKSGEDMYEWVWSVAPDGQDWGVGVRIEVLHIDPDKVNTDSIDEPYISFTMEAFTPDDGLIKRVGPDTRENLSPVVIHDDYQMQRMWERMEKEIGSLTGAIVDYIHNRLEEE